MSATTAAATVTCARQPVPHSTALRGEGEEVPLGCRSRQQLILEVSHLQSVLRNGTRVRIHANYNHMTVSIILQTYINDRWFHEI